MQFLEPFFRVAAPEEAFYREALRAEQEYLETGLHLTGPEVRAWLQRLKTDPKTPPPPCQVIVTPQATSIRPPTQETPCARFAF